MTPYRVHSKTSRDSQVPAIIAVLQTHRVIPVSQSNTKSRSAEAVCLSLGFLSLVAFQDQGPLHRLSYNSAIDQAGQRLDSIELLLGAMNRTTRESTDNAGQPDVHRPRRPPAAAQHNRPWAASSDPVSRPTTSTRERDAGSPDITTRIYSSTEHRFSTVQDVVNRQGHTATPNTAVDVISQGSSAGYTAAQAGDQERPSSMIQRQGRLSAYPQQHGRRPTQRTTYAPVSAWTSQDEAGSESSTDTLHVTGGAPSITFNRPSPTTCCTRITNAGRTLTMALVYFDCRYKVVMQNVRDAIDNQPSKVPEWERRIHRQWIHVLRRLLVHEALLILMYPVISTPAVYDGSVRQLQRLGSSAFWANVEYTLNSSGFMTKIWSVLTSFSIDLPQNDMDNRKLAQLNYLWNRAVGICKLDVDSDGYLTIPQCTRNKLVDILTLKGGPSRTFY